MSKGYIVLSRDFIYDDEYYRREEGGTPVRIFTDPVAAKAYANELTAKKLMETEITSYVEDIEDACSHYNKKKYPKGILAAIENIVGINVYNDEGYEFPSNMTMEQAVKVVGILDKLDFYFVTETDMEEQPQASIDALDDEDEFDDDDDWDDDEDDWDDEEDEDWDDEDDWDDEEDEDFDDEDDPNICF